jgi:hypothetical protein
MRWKKEQHVASDKLIESMDALIEAENILAKESGMADFNMENIKDSFWWLSLKFLDSHPEVAAEMLSHPSDIPKERLAEILSEAVRKSIPSSCVLRGLSIRLRSNSYDFCISGSISEDDFEKLSGLREEWLYPECENQSKN